MIKRILKLWLKRKMRKKFDESAIHFNEAFEWVSDSPMREWKTKIGCISQCWSRTTTPNLGLPITKIDLQRAIRMFALSRIRYKGDKNMIKRIFRKHLRRDMVIEYGASCPEFEEIFNWIYEAPILEWRIRMYCVSKTRERIETKDKYGQIKSSKIVIRIDKAKELLWFLSK